MSNIASRLVKEIRNGIPVYTLVGDFCYVTYKLHLEGEEWRWVTDLESAILKELSLERPFSLIYRGVKPHQLDDVLKNGSDIPNQRVGTDTWATQYLDKTFEAGGRASLPPIAIGEAPPEDILVMIYDRSGLRLRDMSDIYKFTFVKEPKEVLKGALLLKPVR